MTKKTIVWAVAMTLVLGAVALGGDAAGSVTLEGKITCAKCTIGAADAKECQNVLVVDQEGAAKHYYVVKNDVAEQFGHACKGEKGAVVTGTVADKDGKSWITATKMEPPQEKKA